MIMMIFMIIMKMGGGCWCWYWQSSVRWTTYMSCHDDSYENGRRMLMLMLMITSVRWTTQKFSSTVCPGSRRDLNQQIITIIMHSDLNQHIIRIIIHCHHDLDARSHVPPFHDQNVHFQSDHENCWVNKFIMFPLPFEYDDLIMPMTNYLHPGPQLVDPKLQSQRVFLLSSFIQECYSYLNDQNTKSKVAEGIWDFLLASAAL